MSWKNGGGQRERFCEPWTIAETIHFFAPLIIVTHTVAAAAVNGLAKESSEDSLATTR